MMPRRCSDLDQIARPTPLTFTNQGSIAARDTGVIMIRTTVLHCAALSLALTPVIARAAEPIQGMPPDLKKAGSLYLQCDGNPNNMSAGESIARLIALSAVIGLLAPSPEVPDASKRKFGTDGIAACDGILSGEKAEGNAVRRIPLILARALHRIEAKDYAGAITDVTAARNEARTAGLAGNPYFDQSTGLGFDLIEAQALLRMGKVEEARHVNARGAQNAPFSYYPLLVVRNLNAFSSAPITPLEEARLRSLAKFSPFGTFELAALLDEAGRFGDSAQVLRSLDDFQSLAYHDDNSDSISLVLGTALANSYALANDWANAELFDARNQKLISRLRTDGKEFRDETQIVERMDFFSIVKLARNGALAEARRAFAARSRWTAPTFGQIIEMNRRLRTAAQPQELFGFLADTPETLIERRKKEFLARLLERDKDNKSLFSYILPYASVSGYERMSGRVWNTNSNRIIAKEKRPKSDVYMLSVFDADPLTQPEILLLHAALQAKARGFSGLVFRLIPDQPSLAFVYFANPGAPGIADQQYLDADAVTASLRKVIPSPQDIKERSAVSKTATP